ncbi:MAG: dienelactone hydrolase family protein [Planctomycetes bacterium]|nr:dienelactone hydrolase family protein [Planctomycetota bacterium]
MKQAILSALAVLLLAASVHAEVLTKEVEYHEGDTVLKGYLAYDTARDHVDGKIAHRPAVIVVPEWWGLSDYPKRRAVMLAELGYVAFAADIYGGGRSVNTPEEAGKLATQYKNDRPLLRKRIAAALDTVRKMDNVDPNRIAAIGYCFGGTTVLELARSGAKVAGVVSFHGGLDTPTPEDAKNIHAKILVLHGADDPYEPPAQVAAFLDEMRGGKVDFQFIQYSNAVHGFTNPNNKTLKLDGVGYNEEADRRSWQHMRNFFDEIFATPSTR